MTAVSEWRKRIVARANEKSIDTTRLESRTAQYFWWFGQRRAGKGRVNEYVYLELRCEPSLPRWFAFGGIISANSDVVYVGIEPFLVESTHPATPGNGIQQLKFELTSEANSQRYLCVVEVSLNRDSYQLFGIDISVYARGRYRRNGVDKFVWQSTQNFSSNAEVSIDVPCHECNGRGFVQEFSIPKKDFESGLTGYALYECNIICCTTACKMCGGKGTKYERWYLDENPDIPSKETRFVRGSGHVLVVGPVTTGPRQQPSE